jgi:uncharacterized repeat protein (TIGR03803 family)
MKKSSPWKMVCIVFVYCAATAITSPAQTFTTLVSFEGTNGANPASSLIQASDGNFYGTTEAGGTYSDGTVFKITPGGTLARLHSFHGTDGATPDAGLVQGSDGNFYGTTSGGGANGYGTVFKITPGGALATVHTFDYTDGSGPTGSLIQATNGNFYGTTSGGGAYGDGTVFKITPRGTFTTLHSFAGTEGAFPYAGLVQGSDGNFYGTTHAGGAYYDGTVFKITPGGTLTMLHSFDVGDGAFPYAGLVQGADGNFYGTTTSGGAIQSCGVYHCGTVFKITPGGTLTTLHSFGVSDGAYPEAGLVQASDGNFYGTTSLDGTNSYGTVFRITPAGALTTLYSFCSQQNCTDGSKPYGGLVQAINGNLYGTTYVGGTHNDGTVFSLSPSPQQFVSVTPCRLVDTRPQYGGGGPIQGGTHQDFAISGAGSCGIPASGAAYSLNVTVVPQGPLGYLTIWPTGEYRPVVSTMNSVDGRVKADAAIVPAGTSGEVSVYVTNTTDVILDIDGYFAPVSGSTLAFYPLPPCRVADTRDSTKPTGLGPPQMFSRTPRDFPVLSSTCIPSGVNPVAYSFNFTVVPGGHSVGYLSVWPTGQNQPVVSTLNDQTGTIVANAAIVPAGTGGDVSVYATDNTQLVIDIDGYFAPAGQGGLSLYAVAPCRVIDTRHVGSGQPFSGILTPPVDVVGSPCGPPATALAYVFNATVIPVSSLGYLTLWPDGGDRPTVSTLNASDGWITNNMAIVPAGTQGKIDAYAGNGLTQLILDISSYFAP